MRAIPTPRRRVSNNYRYAFIPYRYNLPQTQKNGLALERETHKAGAAGYGVWGLGLMQMGCTNHLRGLRHCSGNALRLWRSTLRTLRSNCPRLRHVQSRGVRLALRLRSRRPGAYADGVITTTPGWGALLFGAGKQAEHGTRWASGPRLQLRPAAITTKAMNKIAIIFLSRAFLNKTNEQSIVPLD